MGYGNYDAGQQKHIWTNPYMDGGSVPAEKKVGFNFDFGFKRTEATPEVEEDYTVASAMGFKKTTPTSNSVEVAATQTYGTLQTYLGAEAEQNKAVDEMLSPYITPETRERMSSTSFNMAMALGDFEEMYNSLG